MSTSLELREPSSDSHERAPLQRQATTSKFSFVLSLVTNRLFLLFPAFIAIVGFAIHASLLFKHNFGGYVYPQSRSFMMALSVMFFCAEGLMLKFSPSDVLPSNKHRRTAVLAFAWSYCAVSIFLFLMNVSGQREDGALWSLALILVTTVNAVNAKRLLENASDNPTRSRCMSVCIYTNYSVHFLAMIFYIMLLVGTSIQTDGWIRYPPNGTFVTLQFGQFQQRILTQCSPPTANANPTYPTVWLETGGGGHGMADLWPLRDALNFQGFRVCSYDMPGIGHSSHIVRTQNRFIDNDSVMRLVMEQMKENGPFILMGSMNSAQDRVYQFALNNPSRVSAIVIPGGAGRFNEATGYAKFKGISNSDAVAWYRQQLQARLTFGTILSIAIDWGLMPLFAPPNPNYGISLEKAREKVFLNNWNDKAWSSNVFVGLTQPLGMSDTELAQVTAMSVWVVYELFRPLGEDNHTSVYERIFARPMPSIPVVIVQRDPTRSTNNLYGE